MFQLIATFWGLYTILLVRTCMDARFMRLRTYMGMIRATLTYLFARSENALERWLLRRGDRKGKELE